MINANELRIGNCIQDEYFRIGLVMSLSRNSIRVKFSHSTMKRDSHTGIDGVDVEPIQLTIEILEKCGFEKTGEKTYRIETGYYKGYRDHLHKRSKMIIKFYDNKKGNSAFVISPANSTIILKHLHELQNLYFVLTGIELSLKEFLSSKEENLAEYLETI